MCKIIGVDYKTRGEYRKSIFHTARCRDNTCQMYYNGMIKMSDMLQICTIQMSLSEVHSLLAGR